MHPHYEQHLREGPLLLWAGEARLGLKAAEGSGKPCFLSCSAAPCSPASAEMAPPHSPQPHSDSQIRRKEHKLEPKVTNECVEKIQYLQLLYTLAHRFCHVSDTPGQTHVKGRVLLKTPSFLSYL